MLESAADAHTSTSLPYGLLITRIILYHSIDRAAYPVVEVFATYDSNTFASMGYFLVKNEWCKKDSIRVKSDLR